MKKEMTLYLKSRYQSSRVSQLLDVACFVDPRFKSMPFLNEEEVRILHEHIIDKLLLYVDLQADEGGEEGEKPLTKKPRTGLGKLLCNIYSKQSIEKPTSSQSQIA